MSTRSLWRSFASGEITPELLGRVDLVKYQTGLAQCRNFRVLPHGPAQRRPGFRFIQQLRGDKVRIIPFQFSATDTAVIELGAGYARFHVDGATVLENAKPCTVTAPNTINCTAHGYTVGKWVALRDSTISPTYTRFVKVAGAATNSFTVVGLRGEAVTIPASAVFVAAVYEVTLPYAAADLFALRYTQSADVLTITHPSYPAVELRRLAANNWSVVTVTFAPPPAPATAPTVTPTIVTTGTAAAQTYAYTYIDATGAESLPSPVTTVSNPLNLAGNFNTITATAQAGAQRYLFYKRRGGVLSYIGQSTTTSIVDDFITADATKGVPQNIYTLNTAPGTYPAAVTYHEQRRWFAGTSQAPQTIWATRSGTESNLSSSVPLQDDDGLQFRIAARQNNTIQHLVPLGDLIALTVGGEFRVFTENTGPLTPASLTVKPQGYTGVSEVTPVVTAGSVLYVQAQGSRIQEMAYDWQKTTFASTDISIMSPHLFNGFRIADMAFSRAPVRELWAARNDGTLLCLTYAPEQQVYGWSRHDTQGAFESVCVVAEDSEDAVYVVAKRTVGGADYRYLERLDTRIFTDQAKAFFVDSGLSYNGPAVSSVTGLWHLEGKTVQVLGDGAVHPSQVVVNGTVALEAPASAVSVGLAYDSDLQTLPLAMEAAPAGGQGMVKNVNSVRMRVTQSSAIKAGPRFDKLVEYPAREVSDPYDTPPALRTGELRMAVPPSWSADAAICLRQDLPLPLTVLSMVLDVQTAG